MLLDLCARAHHVPLGNCLVNQFMAFGQFHDRLFGKNRAQLGVVPDRALAPEALDDTAGFILFRLFIAAQILSGKIR